MFILFVLLVFILGASLNALILKFINKKFKVQNNTYKNAFLVSFLEILVTGLIGVIIGLFFSGLFGNIISVALGFLIFNLLCKKYYTTNLKKNISIYLLLRLIIVVISLIIILPIRFFVAEPFYVTGKAMEPSFPDKTYLLINKFDKDFQRGDVITFKYPKDQNQYFIKRIIGLPGEKVEIQKDGSVIIYNAEKPNGLKLGEPYILNGSKILTIDNSPTFLDLNEYYVLGDNPGTSKDSRSFGPVNKRLIIGKYWFTPKLY